MRTNCALSPRCVESSSRETCPHPGTARLDLVAAMRRWHDLDFWSRSSMLPSLSSSNDAALTLPCST
uniref:Uncharacterized protein n=1 Tax=Arundo donax TaxID=35708 RepID=A0A0A9GIM5_ARUDO